MNFLKTTVASLLLFGSLATAGTFEQNGVKEGNNKVSIGLYSTYPDGKDSRMTLYGGVGHFLTDDFELALNTLISTSGGDTFYNFNPGVNYYFLKQPTLTPYTGATFRFYGTTVGNGTSDYGTNYHIGAHQFFSENAAITAEIGADFFEFDTYMQSYTNLYLTYFFD